MLGALAFNLIVNAMLSFTGASVAVWLALRLFRVGADRWQLALLGLPWLKVVWDAARGVPESSFFWQRASGAYQDFGSFRAGLGATQWGPLLELRLGAQLSGRSYPQSAAEVLSSGLSRVTAQLPVYVAGAILLVSSLLVARRLWGFRAHARGRRHGQSSVLLVQQRCLGNIVCVVDAAHRGAPYVSGVLAPRVVFSVEHLARLSAAEREACWQHELAHVAHGDTLLSPLLTLLTDAFWFLPGVHWVQRQVRSVMELRADEAALRAGATPEALASALVSTGEHLLASTSPGVGLVRERLLARRVRRLLEPAKEPAPRAGFQHAGVRLVLAALIMFGVLQSVFFGNQPLG
jgi:beta-lactamase regulating signal transducer with metallopeptidase domain